MSEEMKFHFLAIDFESTGLWIREGKHQAITCGAILVDFDTLEEIDRIYMECRVEGKAEWSTAAEKCHGLDYDYVMSQQSMADAATELFGFLVNNGVSSHDYIMMCGHNVDFDIKCFESWMDHINVKFHLSHRKIDTFPLGFGLFGSLNSDELFSKVGVIRNEHNALEDAEAALNVVRHCRTIGTAWDKFGDSFQ